MAYSPLENSFSSGQLQVKPQQLFFLNGVPVADPGQSQFEPQAVQASLPKPPANLEQTLLSDHGKAQLLQQQTLKDLEKVAALRGGPGNIPKGTTLGGESGVTLKLGNLMNAPSQAANPQAQATLDALRALAQQTGGQDLQKQTVNIGGTQFGYRPKSDQEAQNFANQFMRGSLVQRPGDSSQLRIEDLLIDPEKGPTDQQRQFMIQGGMQLGTEQGQEAIRGVVAQRQEVLEKIRSIDPRSIHPDLTKEDIEAALQKAEFGPRFQGMLENSLMEAVRRKELRKEGRSSYLGDFLQAGKMAAPMLASIAGSPLLGGLLNYGLSGGKSGLESLLIPALGSIANAGAFVKAGAIANPTASGQALLKAGQQFKNLQAVTAIQQQMQNIGRFNSLNQALTI